MDLTYDEFLKTPFISGCIVNNIDTETLFDLCKFVGVSHQFENLDTAFIRLKKALPFSIKLYRNEKVFRWQEVIQSLEPHFDKEWFRRSVKFVSSFRIGAQNPLGSDGEKFPFYGALITDLGSDDEEQVRSKIFGQILAFNFHFNDPSSQPLPKSSFKYVLNSIRKAGRYTTTKARTLTEARPLGFKTAFLCHSHKDQDLVKGLITLLVEAGWQIYVDWADSSMPETPNRQTAGKIKKRIEDYYFFLFLATANSMASRWCPWEIGYADGKNLLIRF